MMRRGRAIAAALLLIAALVGLVRAQGEVFPVASLPIILSHDPIPTATPLPPTATPIPQGVIPNGNFEAGRRDWAEYSDFTYDLIRTTFPGSVTPHGGAWAAWLGGVYAEGNDETTTTAISQPIVISSAKAYLSYWYWIASADACGYDVGGVVIDNGGSSGIALDAFSLCSRNNTGGWKHHVLDLRPYAGQTVVLYFLVGTDDTLNSNWFVDDVSVQAKATTVEDAPPSDVPAAAVAHRPAPSSDRNRPQQVGNAQERLLRVARRVIP